VAASTVSSNSTSRIMVRFFPQYMVNDPHYTQAQAVVIAQQFDVIAARDGVFTQFVGAMKAVHPSLSILVGMDGMYDFSSGGTAYPASWYAHNSQGNRIRNVGFGFYLMDPTNPAWAASVASNCAALIAKSKYEGCLLDEMGVGAISPGYCTSLPINHATGKVFTATEWISATSAVVKAAKAANSKYAVVPNGLADGSRYFLASGPTKPLLLVDGAAMSEIWLRSPSGATTQYPSVTTWKQDVDMLVEAESHGWTILTTTKLWTGATAAQQAAWHKFTLASFLLGAGGHCAYSFSTASSDTALAATSPWDQIAIGAPTGAYVSTGGMYLRNYSNGVAVVNPGDTAVTIHLGGTYKNLEGASVTLETLPPHSGDVFVG
jgi:Hypothetical glycosyl hydrolase family 15